MEFNTTVNVSKEEILAKFTGEELLEYVKKNYPSKFSPQEKMYSPNQWFKSSWGGYYFLVSVKGHEYFLARLDHQGSVSFWSHEPMIAVDNMIPEKEILKYERESFTPINFADVDKSKIVSRFLA